MGRGKANALTLRTLDWLKVAKYFFLCAALSQGHCRPDENLVKKIDTISSAGRFNLHVNGEFAGRRAIGLTRVCTAGLVIGKWLLRQGLIEDSF
jgi:hypothetical protein